MLFLVQNKLMIQRKPGFSDKEMAEYCERLQRVQERYIQRNFVCRKTHSQKISSKRDVIFVGRKDFDIEVLDRIKESIKHYSNA